MSPTALNSGNPPQYNPQPVKNRSATSEVMKKKVVTGCSPSLVLPQMRMISIRIVKKGSPNGSVTASMKMRKSVNPWMIPAGII
jgi:hypothetical protein